MFRPRFRLSTSSGITGWRNKRKEPGTLRPGGDRRSRPTRAVVRERGYWGESWLELRHDVSAMVGLVLVLLGGFLLAGTGCDQQVGGQLATLSAGYLGDVVSVMATRCLQVALGLEASESQHEHEDEHAHDAEPLHDHEH